MELEIAPGIAEEMSGGMVLPSPLKAPNAPGVDIELLGDSRDGLVALWREGIANNSNQAAMLQRHIPLAYAESRYLSQLWFADGSHVSRRDWQDATPGLNADIWSGTALEFAKTDSLGRQVFQYGDFSPLNPAAAQRAVTTNERILFTREMIDGVLLRDGYMRLGGIPDMRFVVMSMVFTDRLTGQVETKKFLVALDRAWRLPPGTSDKGLLLVTEDLIVAPQYRVFDKGAVVAGRAPIVVGDPPGSTDGKLVWDSGLHTTDRTDRLVLSDAAERARGGAGDDVIQARGGADTVEGGAGNDSLFGGEGNDHLAGGDGDDLLVGGGGHDRLDGDHGNDTLRGDGGGDRLNGGDGADVLYGGDGDDVLQGAGGDDMLFGGSGRDVLLGGGGRDRLDGGRLDDTLFGGAADDQLFGRAGRDELRGGAGSDRLFGGGSSDALYGDDGDDLLSGGGGVDRLEGGIGRDRLFGGGSGDTLHGGPGNDVLAGGGGADQLSGGDGNDRLFGGASGDLLHGGAGRDRLVGGSGGDRLEGGGGDDDLHGGRDRDLLLGNAGHDRLYGGEDRDRLLGGGGDDLLAGGAGDDVLSGGGGNDVLDGGSGNDRLSGGRGADRFVFGRDAGVDVITDFEDGIDAIEFLVRGFGFSDLEIVQDGADAVLTHGGGTVRLLEVDAGQLDAADFHFLAG